MADSQISQRLMQRGWRLALWLMGNPHDAEDLLQRGLEVLISKSKTLDRHMWKYFARVLTLEARNMRRKLRPQSQAFEPDLAVGGNESSPLERVLSKEYHDQMWQAFSRLPYEQREAISLSVLAGISQRKAASLAGVAASTFKDRVQRGLKTLRAELETPDAANIKALRMVALITPLPSGLALNIGNAAVVKLAAAFGLAIVAVAVCTLTLDLGWRSTGVTTEQSLSAALASSAFRGENAPQSSSRSKTAQSVGTSNKIRRPVETNTEGTRAAEQTAVQRHVASASPQFKITDLLRNPAETSIEGESLTPLTSGFRAIGLPPSIAQDRLATEFGNVNPWASAVGDSRFKPTMGLHPKSHMLALSTSGGEIEIRELPTGNLIERLNVADLSTSHFLLTAATQGGVEKLEFDPDGRYLLVRAKQRSSTVFLVWRCEDWQLQHIEYHRSSEAAYATMVAGSDDLLVASTKNPHSPQPTYTFSSIDVVTKKRRELAMGATAQGEPIFVASAREDKVVMGGVGTGEGVRVRRYRDGSPVPVSQEQTIDPMRLEIHGSTSPCALAIAPDAALTIPMTEAAHSESHRLRRNISESHHVLDFSGAQAAFLVKRSAILDESVNQRPSIAVVRLEEPERPRELAVLGAHVLRDARFSNDGRWIVALTMPGGISVWNARTLELVAGQGIKADGRVAHRRVVALCYSPRGELLATALSDGTIEVRSAGNQSLIAELALEGPQSDLTSVSLFQFDAKGDELLFIHHETIKAWRFRAEEAAVREIARGEHASYLPAYDLIAMSRFSDDPRAIDVETYRRTDASLVGKVRIAEQPEDAAPLRPLSLDGMRLSASSDGRSFAAFWTTPGEHILSPRKNNVAYWEPTATQAGLEYAPRTFRPISCVDLVSTTDDALTALVSTQEVHLHNTLDGGSCRIFGIASGESGNFTAAAWIPNTRLLWLSDSQGTVRILDVGSLISQPKWQSRRIEVSTFQAHHTRINDLAITPGGGHVATAADDGSVRVWRVD